jgi:hypothetical protein
MSYEVGISFDFKIHQMLNKSINKQKRAEIKKVIFLNIAIY